MNTSPTQSLPSGSAAPGWVSVVAGAALACALAPALPLFSIVSSWSAAYLAGPYIALVLAIVTLLVTHRRRAGGARRTAWIALTVVCGWVLLLASFGLALRFA